MTKTPYSISLPTAELRQILCPYCDRVTPHSSERGAFTNRPIVRCSSCGRARPTRDSPTTPPPRRPADRRPSTLARVLVRDDETGHAFPVALYTTNTHHRALLHGLRSVGREQAPTSDPRRLP